MRKIYALDSTSPPGPLSEVSGEGERFWRDLDSIRDSRYKGSFFSLFYWSYSSKSKLIKCENLCTGFYLSPRPPLRSIGEGERIWRDLDSIRDSRYKGSFFSLFYWSYLQ